MAKQLPTFNYRDVPELIWERAPNYEVCERLSEPGLLDDVVNFEPALETVIVPCGDRERYTLWGTDSLVFLSLVNPVPPRGSYKGNKRTTVKGALDFANEWGLLTDHKEMLLSDFVAKSAQFSRALQQLRDGVGSITLPRWTTQRHTALDNKSIYRRSRSLWMYCCLQFEAHLKGGHKFRDCQRCQNVFVPRRGNGVYCSDNCRKRFSEEQS
jgi:hypothetical protein